MKYNLSKFREKYGISRNDWERHKEELLEHLKLYFDFEISKCGKGYCIEIFEQYGEYEPLKKNQKSKDIIAYYTEQTREEVRNQPWNTGSNIARNIIAKDRNVYEHAEGTITNYVRPIIKEKFINPTTEMQWMRLSEDKLCYVPLTNEETEFFKQLLKENNVNTQKAKIMGEYKAGYLSKKEASELIFDLTDNWYNNVISEFKDKYGFIPMCVKHLGEVSF